MERDILGVGLRIIEQLGESAQPIGVRELSRALAIPVGTTHRVLQALKRERLVEQAGERGLYRSGMRIAELSRRFMRAHDLVPTALPWLHDAAERSGDSVAIMVVEGHEAVCAASVEGDQLLRHALARLLLSARAYHRVLRVARSIADLAEKSSITAEHIAEAIQYRRLDASF